MIGPGIGCVESLNLYALLFERCGTEIYCQEISSLFSSKSSNGVLDIAILGLLLRTFLPAPWEQKVTFDVDVGGERCATISSAVPWYSKNESSDWIELLLSNPTNVSLLLFLRVLPLGCSNLGWVSVSIEISFNDNEIDEGLFGESGRIFNPSIRFFLYNNIILNRNKFINKFLLL